MSTDLGDGQPALPLAASAFAAGLRTGHGRVLQHLVRYGATDVASLIVDACVSCWQFDIQCEASRVPWLLEVIEAANFHSRVLRALEEAVAPVSEGAFRDATQRCGLLEGLAR